ncbi:MAG: cupin domain-containing protein [Kofleriaceae bacterium]
MRATTLIAVLMAVAIAACGPKNPDPAPTPIPEPTTEPTAATEPTPAAPPTEPAAAPEPPKPPSTDPIEVTPGTHSLVMENDSVRVLNATFAPGAEAGMHKHAYGQFVYVAAPGKLAVTDADGKTTDMDLKASSGMFIPATSHTAKNIGTTEVKLVIVEMKTDAGAAAPKGTDPLKAGAKIYKKVFEDDHVRAMEVTFAKGAKIAKHTHPDHLAYALTDGKLKVTGEKDTQDLEVKAGQAMFLPAQVHAAQNTGDAPLKLLVVEMKPAGGTPAAK